MSAPARAGLLGNPSDGYYGKCIALPVANFSATVTCSESPELRIVPGDRDRLEFGDLAELVGQIEHLGYYGGVRLLKATLKRFADHCSSHGIQLPDRNPTITYRSDIPQQVGLAGSSAIVTAALRCLLEFYDVSVPEEILPTLALEAEREELGISAGLMDRVIQVYGRVMYMDLGRELLEEHGRGEYVPLESGLLPPLFLAYREGLAEGSELTHNDLRRRFEQGEPEVRETMEELAALTDRGHHLLESGRAAELGPLVDRNFELRARVCTISEGNRQLVEIGRSLGAHVKFAGSGGAVLGVYDGDPERYRRLRRAYAEIGAQCLVPEVDPRITKELAPAGASTESPEDGPD